MTVRVVRRLVLLILLAVGATADRAVPPPPTSRCETLSRLDLPAVTIDRAAIETGGTWPSAAGAMPTGLAPFCRVMATARPTADSVIRFEVWIPAGERWNGKFLGVGNDAFQGVPNYPLMADALARGYATASTDTGHSGGELAFAIGHPEKIVDWAYRSIHLTAQNAKLIIRAAAGRLPRLSYFNGCNTGGHQALMEAQRFPADYDAIVAGSPAAARVQEIAGYLYTWRVTHDAAGTSLLSAADLRLVTAAATRACDAADGLRDGVIGDPERCRFDPATLRCADAQNAGCLSDAQVAAIRAVYRGARNPRTGARIFAGWPIGSEGFGDSDRDGWNGLINIAAPRRSEFFGNFVFDDPHWQWQDFDLDRDYAFAQAKMGFINATSPDLRRFVDRGGKLIIYAGWVDPILPAGEVIDQYHEIRAFMGQAATDRSVRFYMVPGYAHCDRGPAALRLDMIAPLEKWIEGGERPGAVLAKSRDGRSPGRLLCPYPAAALPNRQGRLTGLSSFKCA